MSFTIQIDQLKEKLKQDQKIVIVDVRFNLTDPDAGRKMYLEGHIPDAIYLDLNQDLSGKVMKHGGSHPLPDIQTFSEKLGSFGIDNETTVVVYDQENDMFAARLWWLLQYLGHEKVYVLEGGFKRWVEKGNEVSTEIPTKKPTEFKPNKRSNEVVTMREVKDKVEKKEAILIDSRHRNRYLGIEEPLYKKAGHIPGAVNYFWKDVLNEDGTWKNSEKLERHFSSLPKDAEIIVSCGSGVSACPNILALKSIGYQNVKLYPGSFSDWISYEENEIEIGESK